MEKMIWISQHEMNNGQVSLLPVLGFDGYKKIEVSFTENPVKDLQKAGIKEKKIGIVAPINIMLILLRADYTLYEFRNLESSKRKGLFFCDHVNVHTLTETKKFLCPLPIRDQIKSELRKK